MLMTAKHVVGRINHDHEVMIASSLESPTMVGQNMNHEVTKIVAF